MTTASTVVAHPCATVATQLAVVPSWAPALADVAWALPVGFERYRFGLQHGGDVEEVLVAVRWDARSQRLTWRSFDGPTWTGQLKLHDLDGLRTRVNLDVVALPRTGLEAVTELFGVGGRDLTGELVAMLDAALSPVPTPALSEAPAAAATPAVPAVVPIGRTVVPQPRQAPVDLVPQF